MEIKNLREELSDVYGGATARMAEKTFKGEKIPAISERLNKVGLYTDSIDAALTTMKGEGILSASDFNKLRALDDLSKTGLDAIKTGEARDLYSSMKSGMGEQLTNEIFSLKIEKNLEEIANKTKLASFADKKTGKTPLV